MLNRELMLFCWTGNWCYTVASLLQLRNVVDLWSTSVHSTNPELYWNGKTVSVLLHKGFCVTGTYCKGLFSPPTINAFRLWNEYLCSCTSLLPNFNNVWLGVPKSTLTGALHDPCLKLYCLLIWDILVYWAVHIYGFPKTHSCMNNIHYRGTCNIPCLHWPF